MRPNLSYHRSACGLALVAWLCAIAPGAGAAGSTSTGATSINTTATTAARRLLAEQQADWNHGDIDAFMRGYWKDESIRFAGGDSFRVGWQATIERYRKSYPDTKAMGRLDFDLVEVRELAPTIVYVFGKFHLTRDGEAAEKAPHGLFTLIVEKKGRRWVITRDHTSAAGG
jgi:uncharacterized protein (TIGR02246 family)